MKLTKAKLRQIIKEEIDAQTGPFPSPESMAAFWQSNGEIWDEDGLIMKWLESIPGFLEALSPVLLGAELDGWAAHHDGNVSVQRRHPAVEMIIAAYKKDPRSPPV
jgi:hypothetical protein